MRSGRSEQSPAPSPGKGQPGFVRAGEASGRVPRALGIELTVTGRQVPAGNENLVVRAARLLQERCAPGNGVSIALHKVVPVGAGLGGGSSDAAAALVGLNRLWGLGLPGEALVELGVTLGSDVPFFISAHVTGSPVAVCTGRGERVEPLAARGERWYVVVSPAEALSTSQVYQSLQAPASLTAIPDDGKKVKEAIELGDVGAVRRWCHNDLEEAALALSAGCRRVREMMRETGLSRAMVSGSGSSVFTVCETEEEATRIGKQLKIGHQDTKAAVFVARGLSAGD